MLYVASGNIIWLLGLNDNNNSSQPAYVTGATVTGQVQSMSGQNVGGSVTMTYASGSVTLELPNGQSITSAGGNYKGNLPYTTPLVDGTNYELQVVATYGGDQQTFRGAKQAGYSLES